MIKYGQFGTKYDIFFHITASRALLIQNSGPSETFSIQMCPLNGFEFETPDINHLIANFLKADRLWGRVRQSLGMVELLETEILKSLGQSFLNKLQVLPLVII